MKRADIRYALLILCSGLCVQALSLDQDFFFDSDNERYKNRYKKHNVDLIAGGSSKLGIENKTEANCDALSAIDNFIDATRQGDQSEEARQLLTDQLLNECQADKQLES